MNIERDHDVISSGSMGRSVGIERGGFIERLGIITVSGMDICSGIERGIFIERDGIIERRRSIKSFSGMERGRSVKGAMESNGVASSK